MELFDEYVRLYATKRMALKEVEIASGDKQEYPSSGNPNKEKYYIQICYALWRVINIQLKKKEKKLRIDKVKLKTGEWQSWTNHEMWEGRKKWKDDENEEKTYSFLRPVNLTKIKASIEQLFELELPSTDNISFTTEKLSFV